MSKLLNTAKETVATNFLYEVVRLTDLVALHPEGVNVQRLEFIDFPKTKSVPCLIFEDENDGKKLKCFKATTLLLNKLVEAWLADFEGDVADLNNALDMNRIHLKIQKTTSKNGYNYWRVTVLGEIDMTTGEYIPVAD